jgi:hypothetical protein
MVRECSKYMIVQLPGLAVSGSAFMDFGYKLGIKLALLAVATHR